MKDGRIGQVGIWGQRHYRYLKESKPSVVNSLFEVKSFAQSIRGRLTEKAHRLELKGPDLRTYVP